VKRSFGTLEAYLSIGVFLLLCGLTQANAEIVIKRLQVEYRDTPLGIDVAAPRFSWQMEGTQGERGAMQTAYRIQVKSPAGEIVWDSKRTEGSTALGIKYAGSPLKPATNYWWIVEVWNQKGARLTATSWFETGLMDPSPDSPAWGGAKWIGGGDDDLVLYAPYLEIFKVKYALTIAPDSTRASFVYGANDPRLMDRNKNIYQFANHEDESYIKLELDISGVDGSPDGRARFNVYRAGYKDTDTPAKPLQSFEIPTDVIDNANKHAEHTVSFSSAFGQIAITIDGVDSLKGKVAQVQAGGGIPGFGRRRENVVNLNPMGQGGNFVPFGMLCNIGFALDPGQNASFRGVTVSNNRKPNNTLFREDLTNAPYKGIYADAVGPGAGFSVANGSYSLSGGSKGLFVVKDPSRNSAPMLRSTFEVPAKPIASSRLYVTARGIYEFYVNGRRVGDDYYAPGLTQYNVTHMYQTYDVTSMIKSGNNAMGAILGEGWWSGLLSFGEVWNHFGDRQSLLAKLVITYMDGSAETICTSPETWKFFGHGPLVYSSLYVGEVYDATRERAVAGWNTASYDDSKWKSAAIVPLQGTTFSGRDQGLGASPVPMAFDKLSLIGQIGNGAGIYKTLRAKSVNEVRPGVYVFDLGQNIVGVPRIIIDNGRAGARVTLRYGEVLYPDLKESGKSVGMVMTENYRAAINQDVYVMSAGRQVIQPRFTSHGFQYIEITGIDGPLPLDHVQGVAISSVRELTADYKTSNEKINKLWSNLVWSNVDNFLTIPTDCPQRNERMGWSGDINVFSRTATYVSNTDQFFTRHMYAMRDVQLPSGKFTDVAPVGGGFGGILWGSAGIVVPWETYLQYKDVDLLQRNYPAMAAYMNYLDTTVDPKTGLISDAQLGDWLGPQNNALGTAFLATAYHAYDLGIMAKIAKLLGKSDDAARFNRLYESRKTFFNATFVSSDKKTLGVLDRPRLGPGAQTNAGKPPEFRVADTQTSYAVGLAMDLFSDENKPYMVMNLAEAVIRENKDDEGKIRPKYSLMTGFIGTSWISNALTENGDAGLAYRILENDSYPSWLYSIDQGATTIWERLNGYTVENGFGGNNSMNSFNHYSFGAVGQWMIADSLGIRRDEPGFHKFVLQPEVDPSGGITSAQGYYDSMYGRINSAWEVSHGVLTYHATVPGNTEATLYLPAESIEAVREGGRQAASAEGVSFVKYENGRAVYHLVSGSYVFTSVPRQGR
jgi:alpha-L-rhamnosidase